MTIPSVAARRLSNQIGRAYRGTYGAEDGLRILVCATARQLLIDGATPRSVTRALEQCVMVHPDRPITPPRPMSDVVGSAALVRLTRECVAGVARELEQKRLETIS